jgi:hypothetical protein
MKNLTYWQVHVFLILLGGNVFICFWNIPTIVFNLLFVHLFLFSFASLIAYSPIIYVLHCIIFNFFIMLVSFFTSYSPIFDSLYSISGTQHVSYLSSNNFMNISSWAEKTKVTHEQPDLSSNISFFSGEKSPNFAKHVVHCSLWSYSTTALKQKTWSLAEGTCVTCKCHNLKI